MGLTVIAASVILIFTVIKPVKSNISNENNRNRSLNLSYGFGESYKWHNFEGGLTSAKNEGKPLMVIIHKPECGACKALKSKFSASETALKLSKYFVMVNVASQGELDEKFSPDGKYVPRILFLDSKGNVHSEIYNKHGNPEYKYFYYDMKDIIESMRKAISMLVSSSNAKEL